MRWKFHLYWLNFKVYEIRDRIRGPVLPMEMRVRCLFSQTDRKQKSWEHVVMPLSVVTPITRRHHKFFCLQSAFSLVLKAGVVATRKSEFHPHVPVNKLLSYLFPWFSPVSPWLGLSHGYLLPDEAIPVQEHYISIWGLCLPGASAHVLWVQRCLGPQRLWVHGQLCQVSCVLGSFLQLSSISWAPSLLFKLQIPGCHCHQTLHAQMSGKTQGSTC